MADTLTADLTFYTNGSQPRSGTGSRRSAASSEGDMIRYAIAKPEPLRPSSELPAAVRGDPDGQIVTLEEGVTTVAWPRRMVTPRQTGQRPDSG